MIRLIRGAWERFQAGRIVARIIPRWLVHRELPRPRDLRALADEGYRKNVVAYACIREIATSVAEPELRVLAPPDDPDEPPEPLVDHPLIQLLTHPNPEESQYDFLERAVTFLQASGNAYIHKLRNVDGVPVQLWNLRPDRITIVPGDDGLVDHYVLRVGTGKATDIPVGDVVHLKMPDPLDDYYGLAPIFVAARWADMDLHASDFLRAYFLNAGVPVGLLKLKSRTDKVERDRVKQGWVEEFSGVSGWHSIAVLDTEADYQPIGAQPKDTNLENVLSETELRICAAFGVPPIIVGMKAGLDRSTYCLPATARVWTPTGSRPIVDIRPGESVWSVVSGELKPCRVTKTGQTGRSVIYEVRTKNRTLRASGNHPVLVRVAGTSAAPNAERAASTCWKRVDELTLSDCLVQPKSLPDQCNTRLPDGEPAAAELMQFFGAYVGDGCVSGHMVRVSMPVDDRVGEFYRELAGRLFQKRVAYPCPGKRADERATAAMVAARESDETWSSIGETFGIHGASVRDRVLRVWNPAPVVRAPVNVREVRNGFAFSSVDTAKQLNAFGFAGTAKTKRVPGWVFGLTRELRLAFLAGLVDSDGSVDIRGALAFSFANRPLALDVRQLLISCGIQCSNIYEQVYGAEVVAAIAPGVKPRQQKYYAWRFVASSADRVSELPFADQLYRRRVEANAGRFKPDGKDSARAGLSDDLGFYRVVTIRQLNVEPVYDIEVEGGHSFVADGVVVHNSNYQEARRSFWHETLSPMYRRLASALTHGLAHEFNPRFTITFDMSTVEALQEDQESRRKYGLDGWNAQLLTRTEARELGGLPPIDDEPVIKERPPELVIPLGAAPALPRADAEDDDDSDERQAVRLQLPAPTPASGNGGAGASADLAAAWGPSMPAGAGDRLGRFTDAEADDPWWLAVHRVADRLEPAVRRLFLAGIDAVLDALDGDALEAAIAAGDQRPDEHVPWQRLSDVLTGKVEPGGATFELVPDETLQDEPDGGVVPPSLGRLLLRAERDTGELGAAEVRRAFGDAAREFRFDPLDPLAARWAEEHAGALIRDVTAESRAAVRQLVGRRFAEGEARLTATELRREIEQTVGLTTRQEARVARFRAVLVEKGASAASIERRTRLLRESLVRRRAVMIGRTETIWASNAGMRVAWQQGADKGIFKRENVRKVWTVTPDDRLDVRVCEPLPALDENQNVPLDGQFTTPQGALLDGPPAHPLCRCSHALQSLNMARGTPGARVVRNLSGMAYALRRVAAGWLNEERAWEARMGEWEELDEGDDEQRERTTRAATLRR